LQVAANHRSHCSPARSFELPTILSGAFVGASFCLTDYPRGKTSEADSIDGYTLPVNVYCLHFLWSGNAPKDDALDLNEFMSRAARKEPLRGTIEMEQNALQVRFANNL